MNLYFVLSILNIFAIGGDWPWLTDENRDCRVATLANTVMSSPSQTRICKTEEHLW